MRWVDLFAGRFLAPHGDVVGAVVCDVVCLLTASLPGCPGLLRSKGFDLSQTFLLNLIISLFQIPGYFSAAYLVERWGRKPTLVVFLLLNAVGAFFFAEQGLSAQPNVASILVWGAVMAFFNLGAWGIVYTYTPELYPTRLRGTGSGFAAGHRATGRRDRPLRSGQHVSCFLREPVRGVHHVHDHTAHRRCGGVLAGRGNERQKAWKKFRGTKRETNAPPRLIVFNGAGGAD